MSHDTSSNPILSAYETYFTSTPLVTRFILNTATVSYILSYFIDTNQILSCIPSQAILHLQFYRFFSSPFLCDGLIALLFSYISLLQHGVRLELSMGSTNIAAMVLVLSLMPSVLFSAFAILTHNSFLMSVPFGGIWNIVFAVMAVECSFAPRGETRRFCTVDVQTRYYPCVLLGLVILFSGGTFPYAYILSVIVGYLYGFGKLDFFKMGWERRKELETNGLLRSFTSMQGFTSGPSVDSWTMIDRTGGILGVWNASSSSSSSTGSGGGSDTNISRSNNQQGGWQPTVIHRPTNDHTVTTDTTLRPKHAGIEGKGYRLGGRDRSSSEMHPSHGVSESSSSRRQQHQVDRYAMLAAAERRANSTSQSKDEESHNEHERLLK